MGRGRKEEALRGSGVSPVDGLNRSLVHGKRTLREVAVGKGSCWGWDILPPWRCQAEWKGLLALWLNTEAASNREGWSAKCPVTWGFWRPILPQSPHL